MQCIVFHLFTYNKFRTIPPLDHISNYTPFYEIPSTWGGDGNIASKYDSTHATMGYHVFNTHLYFADMPKNIDNIRYIYVVRNGKDACVSFYHHLSNQADVDQFKGSFDEFLKAFLAGTIVYGKWFSHIKHWLENYESQQTQVRRGEQTVNPILIVQYERLLTNFPEELMKIVHFLNLRITQEELTTNIIPYMTFSYMKQEEKKFAPVSVPWREGFHFIRKGQAGDHKITFTEEQLKLFTEAMENELRDCKNENDEEGTNQVPIPAWLLPWSDIVQ